MKFSIASILALLGIGCVAKEEAKVQIINPTELQKGPIQRETLTNEQLNKIDKIRGILVEIDTQSRGQWIDNFKRDLNVDREITIFEQMANAYKKYCSTNNLTKPAKEEVFQIILLRSMSMSKEEVLKSVDLKTLTKKEAEQVIELY